MSFCCCFNCMRLIIFTSRVSKYARARYRSLAPFPLLFICCSYRSQIFWRKPSTRNGLFTVELGFDRSELPGATVGMRFNTDLQVIFGDNTFAALSPMNVTFVDDADGLVVARGTAQRQFPISQTAPWVTSVSGVRTGALASMPNSTFRIETTLDFRIAAVQGSAIPSMIPIYVRLHRNRKDVPI